MQLHGTYQPNSYYCDFSALPENIQRAFKGTVPEMERSRYTGYESGAFLRLYNVTIENKTYDLEISLGSCDISHSGYAYDDDADEFIDEWGNVVDSESYEESCMQERYECLEIEDQTVYLSEV